MPAVHLLGVHMAHRGDDAVDIQRLLTRYGRLIRTRIGLHDPVEDRQAPGGLILLELQGDPALIQQLQDRLIAAGAQVQAMCFAVQSDGTAKGQD